MPNHTRMKILFLYGPLWLFLLQYGRMVLSLEPGFLDFDNLPDTNFTCHGKVIGGYYADVETNCQMFHVCTKGQAGENMDIRFLCLNGTVFDQETRVCERIDEVDCSKSEQFYSLNLELYQNSGPNAEETPEAAPETEVPSVKSSTTTPATTTTKPSTKSPHYFTTSRPVATTLSGHHFPVNSPDIRFNPEEINISLNPGGAPPDVRAKHFLQRPHHVDFNSDTSKIRVGDSAQRTPQHLSATNTSPKTAIYRPQVNSDVDFEFSENDFRSTEHPRHPQFLIQTNSFRHSQSFPHSANQYLQPHFHSTTVKQDPSHATTSRTLYIHPLKASNSHHYRSEKAPQRVQIPILPTIPPLIFSSPAPFSLHHHVDNKRYTKDQHLSAPRIIISASASVSDASGRRLNYSLGTIGETEIIEDDYKDSDFTLGGLDPFYHDVPKIKRRRRSVEEKSPFDVIKSEKEAVEVLKFLFKWYQSHQATATVPPATSPSVSPDLIRTINDELSPPPDSNLITPRPDSEELFLSSSEEVTSTETLNNGSYSRSNNVDYFAPELVVVTETTQKDLQDIKWQERMDRGDSTTTIKSFDFNDYVDDNYEGVNYKENTSDVSSHNKSHVDPAAVSNLYKYFNVNNQLSLDETLRPLNISKINASESIQGPEKERHTEISVISEVREESRSTLSTPASVRSRGRGRQRHVDNFEEASHTSNQINQISVNSKDNKRRRNRGRSRFLSSTSTTTEGAELTSQELSSTTPLDPFLDSVRETIIIRSKYDNETALNASEAITTTIPAVDVATTEVETSSSNVNDISQSTADFSDKSITSSDPSYLVKLLKYFAESDTEMIYTFPTTELPKTSYDPLTEKQIPYFVTPVGRVYDSTNTPILKTEKVDKAKDELLGKLNQLQKHFSRLEDTTVTTPLVSFDAYQSYGTTTFEGTTAPIPTEYTGSTIVVTTPKMTGYQSFYDDIFVVPELTTTANDSDISTYTAPTSSTTEYLRATKTELETSTEPLNQSTSTIESTTESFEVEIEKSISLPVALLDNNVAFNVNGLVTSTSHQDLETTTDPATTLSVPSVEITLLDELNTSTQTISTSTTISTTIKPLEDQTTNQIIFKHLQETTSSEVTSLNSSHLQEVILETTSPIPISTTTTTSTTIRPSRRRPHHSQRNREFGRHRFNTELSTLAPVNSETITEAPLLKSALPTKTRGVMAKILLHTTPLSSQSQTRPLKVGKHYVFNCFGKETNRFYADPRDCRLFHYCTQGYSKNQLLDLKYVCDHKTYFDEEKLICTKVKPAKCL